MEPVEIVAENGDVFQVAPCTCITHAKGCVVLYFFRQLPNGSKAFNHCGHIPADVLPRVVEALKAKVKL